MSGRKLGPWGETSPRIVLNLEDWTRLAACSVFEDLAIFFPERGASTEVARTICSGCPVWKNCLDYAVRNYQAFGIWGGLTEKERGQIKKAHKVAVCPGCNFIRLFFEKGAVKCDKCVGTQRRRLGLLSSRE